MKKLPFIQVVVLFALVVLVASCGAPLYSTDGYYEEAPVRREVYRSNTYGSAPIIYERDPYTGQYYEVSPYGRNSRTANNPYYSRRSRSGNRTYNDGRYYDNGYNNNRYDSRYGNSNRYGNNNTYRSYPQVQQQPQRAPQTPQQAQKERDEARERILGGRRN